MKKKRIPSKKPKKNIEEAGRQFVKTVDPENMTLKERMAAKFGNDLQISSTKSMYSGSDNLSAR